MKIIYIKRKYLLIGIGLLLLLLGFGILKFKKIKAEPVLYLPITNKIITIDPGHGEPDPGKVSKSGATEEELNLKIGLKLKRLIEQSGGIVIMTRETKDGLHSPQAKTLREMKREDLHKRREIAEDSQSEIFISIHLNSFTQSKYYGAQTFYQKDSEESKELAIIIQKELRNVLDPENNREPQARDDVYLLNEVDIPTVLVEGGFLSNEREEKLLMDEAYQEKIAWAIYVGIMNYFNQM